MECYDQNLFEMVSLNHKFNLVVFKSQDKGHRKIYSNRGMNREKIVKFIEKTKRPDVIVLNEETMEEIMVNEEIVMIFFIDDIEFSKRFLIFK